MGAIGRNRSQSVAIWRAGGDSVAIWRASTRRLVAIWRAGGAIGRDSVAIWRASTRRLVAIWRAGGAIGGDSVAIWRAGRAIGRANGRNRSRRWLPDAEDKTQKNPIPKQGGIGLCLSSGLARL